MKLHITTLEQDYIEFRLLDVDAAFANALRRVLLAEIPMLAVDEVTIHSNTSNIYDEILAHRIGLVPMISQAAKHMNFAWNCPCRRTPGGGMGCTQCTVEMELAVRCRVGESSRQVSSSDFRTLPGPFSEEVYPVTTTHNQGKGSWICTLGPGQEINMHCYVRKGITKEHAKWMTISTVAMRFDAEITLNEQSIATLAPTEKKRFTQLCPVGVYEYNDFHNTISIAHPERCIFCNKCVRPEGCHEDQAIVRHKIVSPNHYNFTFQVEGIGVLPVQEIIQTAVVVLKQKFQRFRDALTAEDGKGAPFDENHQQEGEKLFQASESLNLSDPTVLTSDPTPATGLMSMAWA